MYYFCSRCLSSHCKIVFKDLKHNCLKEGKYILLKVSFALTVENFNTFLIANIWLAKGMFNILDQGSVNEFCFVSGKIVFLKRFFSLSISGR